MKKLKTKIHRLLNKFWCRPKPINFNNHILDLSALCRYSGIETTQKIIDIFEELKQKQGKSE